ncbi:flagellar rod assembly protein/muramidase flgJ [Candidatus Photodesmus blepharus]|uniref:Peptidoglycan hydrolase FlgJ n=1 Tax=Candidatus Photodesmus blepharonis TaxID=1179155 RepID=A0A084CMG0_9GAMM|nr:flagellar assembly peptidoglycan hydrolase FlgJ [Candidatus Photodesmus blepharus]KEY90989.1 flagellar rod assembly protein/muramidase flgJ [Candidatus Photodesmus blepharus]
MVTNRSNVDFIYDVASLDRLRQQAKLIGNEKEVLTAVANQFESIFISILFNSMRSANLAFESDFIANNNEKFYRQMLDEQISSNLSNSNLFGLSDMIVAQLSLSFTSKKNDAAVYEKNLNLSTKSESTYFNSQEGFVTLMQPYADQFAKVLGVSSSLLLAQAALETGWGQKIAQNVNGSSKNLFNIKADKTWQGDKLVKQVLEYHCGMPVKEKAVFRSYRTYRDSFNDYVNFLDQNPRYRKALQYSNNDEGFIRTVHKAGYATDPLYADKVLHIKEHIEQLSKTVL